MTFCNSCGKGILGPFGFNANFGLRKGPLCGSSGNDRKCSFIFAVGLKNGRPGNDNFCSDLEPWQTFGIFPSWERETCKSLLSWCYLSLVRAWVCFPSLPAGKRADMSVFYDSQRHAKIDGNCTLLIGSVGASWVYVCIYLSDSLEIQISLVEAPSKLHKSR